MTSRDLAYLQGALTKIRFGNVTPLIVMGSKIFGSFPSSEARAVPGAIFCAGVKYGRPSAATLAYGISSGAVIVKVFVGVEKGRGIEMDVMRRGIELEERVPSPYKKSNPSMLKVDEPCFVKLN